MHQTREDKNLYNCQEFLEDLRTLSLESLADVTKPEQKFRWWQIFHFGLEFVPATDYFCSLFISNICHMN